MEKQYKPGQFRSGADPRRESNGRPKSLRAKLEARFGANGEDAWDCLERIMTGKEESIEERIIDGRIVEVRRRPTITEKKEAAETIISYIEGKATQINLNANVDATPDKLDDMALRTRVAEIMARFAAPALEAPKPAAQETVTVKVLPANEKA